MTGCWTCQFVTPGHWIRFDQLADGETVKKSVPNGMSHIDSSTALGQSVGKGTSIPAIRAVQPAPPRGSPGYL